jgi:hypothetical protein
MGFLSPFHKDPLYNFTGFRKMFLFNGSYSFVTVLYVSKNSGSYSEVQRYTRSNLNKNTSTHFTKTTSYTNFNSLKFKVTTDETHKIQEKLEGNNTAFSNTIPR